MYDLVAFLKKIRQDNTKSQESIRLSPVGSKDAASVESKYGY